VKECYFNRSADDGCGEFPLTFGLLSVLESSNRNQELNGGITG